MKAWRGIGSNQSKRHGMKIIRKEEAAKKSMACVKMAQNGENRV
jgi:hypothetical protein